MLKIQRHVVKGRPLLWSWERVAVERCLFIHQYGLSAHPVGSIDLMKTKPESIRHVVVRNTNLFIIINNNKTFVRRQPISMDTNNAANTAL